MLGFCSRGCSRFSSAETSYPGVTTDENRRPTVATMTSSGVITRARPLIRSARCALAELPVSVSAIVLAASGRQGQAVERQTRITDTTTSAHVPGSRRVVTHAVLAAAVSLLAWFVAFLVAVGAARGLLYPIFGGSYENAWGGPTLVGAWAVHALVAVICIPIFVLAIGGLGIVHQRLASRMLGGSGPVWPVPVAAAICVLGVLLFVSWWQQA